jgi:hypothetical protein
MEGSCSTGQSPQRAVVPMEEEEEEYINECFCFLKKQQAFGQFVTSLHYIVQ